MEANGSYSFHYYHNLLLLSLCKVFEGHALFCVSQQRSLIIC